KVVQYDTPDNILRNPANDFVREFIGQNRLIQDHPITRDTLQDLVKDLQKKLGKTFIFVTHDMDEAIKLADRICIMSKGKVVQYDTPDNILRNPANDFVREFIGQNRLIQD
ncbi:hypothetical protein EF900_19570, partial [Staphylococcus aureus]